ncbi:MAG TPA: HD domain-containing phosphohydrolase [Chloroflexia bacterium]|jgi:putative nucleotidyltransferase with HDIG domain
MGNSKHEKAQETAALPVVTNDPVLAHLRQAEEHYEQFRRQWERQAGELTQARLEVGELVASTASLQASLQTAQEQAEQQAARVQEVQALLDRAQESVSRLEASLNETQELREQERRAAMRYRDRAAQMAEGFKQIHRAMFEGGVYGLILKACLTITGATRGLYVTTRGGIDNLRIRAAEDIDGYPESPPSEFVKAICKRVLEENDSLVCNSEQELSDLPRPQREGEHFQNLVATPVVLLRSLNGIIIAADKLNGDFDEGDIETLLSVGDQAAIAVENKHLQQELQNSYVATVSMLADAVEAKDPYTHGHCDLVSRYARLIAEQMDLEQQDRAVICYAALLHDVGKIGVSDGVLNKPGPLLPEERELMRSHVRVGHDLLSKVPALSRVADVVLHHHEWYDGSGYPDGLRGDQIPIAARIVCCVDAYCAMITKRSYKEAYSVDRAREELLRCAGTQFDPTVVQIFLSILDTTGGELIDDGDEEDAACGVLPGFYNLRELTQPVH